MLSPNIFFQAALDNHTASNSSKNVVSVTQVTEVFGKLAFFALKVVYSKYNLQESESTKRSNVTLSGAECIDMKNGAIREIGTYFFL